MAVYFLLIVIVLLSFFSAKTPGAVIYGTVTEGGVGALRPSSRTGNSNDRTESLSGHGELHDQGLYRGRVLALSCKARLRADTTIHDSCRVESESALRRCQSSYWHRRAYRGNGWSLASFHDQTRHYLPIVNVTRKMGGLDRSVL
jgi:hypothetical protein